MNITETYQKVKKEEEQKPKGKISRVFNTLLNEFSEISKGAFAGSPIYFPNENYQDKKYKK